MVSEDVINFLKIIADHTRFIILDEILKEGEKSASEIEQEIGKSQSTVSQQLKRLIESDLLSVRKDGAKKIYKVKNPEVFEVLSLIISFVDNQNRKKIESIASKDIEDTLL